LVFDNTTYGGGYAQVGMALDIAILHLRNVGQPCGLTVPESVLVSSGTGAPTQVPLLDVDGKNTYLIQPGSFTVSLGVLSFLDTSGEAVDPCPSAVANVDHVQVGFSPATIAADINPAWRSVCRSGEMTTIEIGQGGSN